MLTKKTGVFIVSGRRPWAHELRVAEILARNNHYVEFLPEGLLPCADILLDGIEYEIKSPEHFNPNTLEHTIRSALKQSPNIIIDTSRMKRVRDAQVQRFLIGQVRKAKQLKRMIMVTKTGRIVDIFTLA